MSRLNSLSLEEFGRRRCGPRYRAGARSHGGCDLAPLVLLSQKVAFWELGILDNFGRFVFRHEELRWITQ